jgi:DNA invertase Pin-like site-specific DNA recombinase
MYSNMHSNNLTAAIYVSVGTPDHDQNTQMAAALQYALQKRWKVLEYRERRGRAATRPVLGQMMYRLRQHKFDVVLVASMDCLARSLTELYEHVDRLHLAGIGFVSVDESIDTSTAQGLSFLPNLAVFAKAERNMIRCNVRTGVAMAKRKGVHCGRPKRQFPRAEARKLRAEGISIRTIAAQFGIPASTLADALRPDGR